jgi:hypothetical protein
MPMVELEESFLGQAAFGLDTPFEGLERAA